MQADITRDHERVFAPLLHQVVERGPLASLWPCEDGTWPSDPTIIEGLSGRVALEAVGATIKLADVYRAVSS